jgi:RNA polymerase sigma-70 factor, ECF subfamily
VSPKEREALLANMYDEYADTLFRFFYFKVSDREVAQDLIQDTFTKIWGHVSRGGEIGNTQAFVFTVARRLVIDTWRKKKAIAMSRLEDAEGNSYDTVDESVNILAEAEFKSTLDTFKKLSDDDRILLELRFVEDLPVKEIAGILKERENTVSVRINRALAKLKKHLNMGN